MGPPPPSSASSRLPFLSPLGLPLVSLFEAPISTLTMGSTISAETRFLQSLQDELVSRKINVSKADLAQFFNVLHKASPWFVFTAPKVSRSTWLQLGQELSEFCDKQDDSAFKECIMQCWKLLDGLITAAPISSTCAAIIKESQAILASASRSQTPVSSQAPPPYVSPAAPSAPLPSTTSTSTASSFVALTRSPSQDQLSPDDEATLEEAAAVYDSQSQPLPPGPLSSQPPSFSSPAVRTPQDPLRPLLEKMCSTLHSVLAKVSSSPPQPQQAIQMVR